MNHTPRLFLLLLLVGLLTLGFPQTVFAQDPNPCGPPPGGQQVVQIQWDSNNPYFYGDNTQAGTVPPGQTFGFSVGETNAYAGCINHAGQWGYFFLLARPVENLQNQLPPIPEKESTAIGGVNTALPALPVLSQNGLLTVIGQAYSLLAGLVGMIVVGGLLSPKLDKLTANRANGVKTMLRSVSVVWIASFIHYLVAHNIKSIFGFVIPEFVPWVLYTAATLFTGYAVKKLWGESGEIRDKVDQAGAWGSGRLLGKGESWPTYDMAAAAAKGVLQMKDPLGKQAFTTAKPTEIPGGWDFMMYPMQQKAPRDITLMVLFSLAAWLGLDVSLGGIHAIATLTLPDVLLLITAGFSLLELYYEVDKSILWYLAAEIALTFAALRLWPWLPILGLFVPELIVSKLSAKFFAGGGFDTWIFKGILITLACQFGAAAWLFGWANPYSLW